MHRMAKIVNSEVVKLTASDERPAFDNVDLCALNSDIFCPDDGLNTQQQYFERAFSEQEATK